MSSPLHKVWVPLDAHNSSGRRGGPRPTRHTLHAARPVIVVPWLMTWAWVTLTVMWPVHTHLRAHRRTRERQTNTCRHTHKVTHTHKRIYTHSNSSSHSHTYIHTHKRTHRYTLIDTQLSLFLTHTYACTQTRKHTYIYLNTININIYTQSRRRAHKDTHMVTHSPFPSLHAAVSCLTTHLYGPFEHLPPVEFSPSPLLPVLMCLPCVLFQPKRNSCKNVVVSITPQ